MTVTRNAAVEIQDVDLRVWPCFGPFSKLFVNISPTTKTWQLTVSGLSKREGSALAIKMRFVL